METKLFLRYDMGVKAEGKRIPRADEKNLPKHDFVIDKRAEAVYYGNRTNVRKGGFYDGNGREVEGA